MLPATSTRIQSRQFMRAPSLLVAGYAGLGTSTSAGCNQLRKRHRHAGSLRQALQVQQGTWCNVIAYEQLRQAKAGAIEPPAVDAMLGQMPELVWPG